MAFDLSSIKPTRRDTPERILIHGPHKVGKSTFGAMAPSSIFIPTEDGQDNLDAQAFPLCKSWDDITAAITTLYIEDHEFKTVVLDSADWSESLAQKKVAENHNVDGIEGIGYGKGYTYVADLFREVLDGLNALRLKKGMRVVLLCHSEIRRFDDPQADSYDRYQIKLHKLVGKLVQEWSDVIGFAQMDVLTKVEEKKGFKAERTRAIDSGRRVLRLEGGAAFDAGNRYSLPAELPLEWPAFEEALNQAKEQTNG